MADVTNVRTAFIVADNPYLYFARLTQWWKRRHALPQKLLWGSLQLQVEQHPRTVLTLRVYTLRQDKQWLEL